MYLSFRRSHSKKCGATCPTGHGHHETPQRVPHIQTDMGTAKTNSSSEDLTHLRIAIHELCHELHCNKIPCLVARSKTLSKILHESHNTLQRSAHVWCQLNSTALVQHVTILSQSTDCCSHRDTRIPVFSGHAPSRETQKEKETRSLSGPSRRPDVKVAQPKAGGDRGGGGRGRRGEEGVGWGGRGNREGEGVGRW